MQHKSLEEMQRDYALLSAREKSEFEDAASHLREARNLQVLILHFSYFKSAFIIQSKCVYKLS